MKKIFYTLALVVSLSSTAQAQRNVSLGLKAGASFSTFMGTQSSLYDGLFGVHAGVFANIGLSRMVAFQPEIIYSQKGTMVRYAVDLKTRLHYIDVPLAFHVNAGGLFFEAGPQVGLLMGASQDIGNRRVDIKNEYKPYDVGYLAGLGYQRKTGPGVGIRYNGGFTRIPKDYTAGIVTVQDNVRNSVVQLYITYSLGG